MLLVPALGDLFILSTAEGSARRQGLARAGVIRNRRDAQRRGSATVRAPAF